VAVEAMDALDALEAGEAEKSLSICEPPNLIPSAPNHHAGGRVLESARPVQVSET
jgi:hypothetical protein